MKRVLLLVLVAMLFAAPALADFDSINEWAKTEADKLAPEDRVVNVYTWEYYIPDEVVAAFEEATGIRVNYSPFSENEEMLAKLQAQGGQYDIIVCSDYVIEIMRQADMLENIDVSRLPNYENIDEKYQGQYYDPDNLFTIPYTNTVPLIVYDPNAVDFEVTGYADLWREEFNGKLVVIDDMRNIIGMAQKKLGLSYNETDPDKMAEVSAELAALKDNITVFNADTPHNALIGGDAIAGFMFGSQIVAAQEVIPDLVTVYPSEGLGYGIDCLIIPGNPPHEDAAYILLNYLLDGEVSAYASELINYGNCNTEAFDYLPENFKSNIAVNPSAEQIASAEMIYPLEGDAQRLYDDIWTEFRK